MSRNIFGGANYAGKEFDRFFTDESEWAQPGKAAPRPSGMRRWQSATRRSTRNSLAMPPRLNTRPFYRSPEQSPRNQIFHYHGNAETYMLLGEVMGNAMVEMKKSP